MLVKNAGGNVVKNKENVIGADLMDGVADRIGLAMVVMVAWVDLVIINVF